MPKNSGSGLQFHQSVVKPPGYWQCFREDCEITWHEPGYRHPGDDPLDDRIIPTRRQLREMVASEVNRAITAAFERLDRQASGAICTSHDWKDRTDGRRICRSCFLVEDKHE